MKNKLLTLVRRLMAPFSYKTEWKAELYQDLLKQFAVLFIRWRHKNLHITKYNIDRQFDIWWMSRGPTGFTNNIDVLRFKKELKDYIKEQLSEQNASTTVGHSS